jgi:hypothetical protein
VYTTDLEVALSIIDEALGEHLINTRVLPICVRSLGVAVVNLEHAAGRKRGGKVKEDSKEGGRAGKEGRCMF